MIAPSLAAGDVVQFTPDAQQLAGLLAIVHGGTTDDVYVVEAFEPSRGRFVVLTDVPGKVLRRVGRAPFMHADGNWIPRLGPWGVEA